MSRNSPKARLGVIAGASSCRQPLRASDQLRLGMSANSRSNQFQINNINISSKDMLGREESEVNVT